MSHHDLLPSESLAVDSPFALVVVGHRLHRFVRLRVGLHELGVSLVPCAAGVLLHDHGQGMHHDAASHI